MDFNQSIGQHTNFLAIIHVAAMKRCYVDESSNIFIVTIKTILNRIQNGWNVVQKYI